MSRSALTHYLPIAVGHLLWQPLLALASLRFVTPIQGFIRLHLWQGRYRLFQKDYPGPGAGPGAGRRNLLLLTLNGRRVTRFRDIDDLRHIYDSTTLLLAEISTFANSIAYQGWPSKWWASGLDTVETRNLVANLAHVLGCLQQAALEALIYHGLRLSAGSAQDWHQDWLQERQLDLGWSSEWPNSRRPLSTTWPWNIRPSLVVLWGVCWMFYDNSTKSAQELRQQLEDEEFVSSGWTCLAPPSATPSRQNLISCPTGNNNHTSLRGPAWLHLEASGGVKARRANVLARNPGNNPPLPFLPAHRHSAPSSAATLSPDCNVWQNPFVEQPQHSQQQPQPSLLNPRRILPSTALQPHVFSSHQAASQGQNGEAATFSPSLRLPEGQMQTHPSPQSDVSRDEIRSSCFSLLPGHDMSLNRTLATSPSIESHHSHPSAGRKTEEAPRNDEGRITCIHPKCVRDPPLFSRRSEWTKHMDKHTRPYVCNLPGCEKVRGFTYSGGLSRHQREVHRQYGGPKASYMCPHRDCKRSTGSGFSRRENLQEHVRRVHRQVSDAETDKQVAVEASSPVPTAPKRRRRQADDDDDGNDDEPEPALCQSRKRRRNDNDSDEDDTASDPNQREELSAEVKRLREELRGLDERLRKSEQTVELLVKRTA
ncbi:MAG: hypothetical protein Q9196_001161 [Gyalolechia fulgens]